MVVHMFDSPGIELLPGESDDAEELDNDDRAYQLTWNAFWDEETWEKPSQVFLPDGLGDMTPGPFLGALLGFVDRAKLSGHDTVRLLHARDRFISSQQAEFYADVHEVAHAIDADTPQRSEEFLEFALDEVGAALTRTRRSAETEVELSYDLIDRLPEVWEALRAGAIDLRKARVFIRETEMLDIPVARKVVSQVLSAAPGLTTGQLRARLHRMVIEADPDTATKHYEMGIEDRHIVKAANPDGTASLLTHHIAPDDAAAIMGRLTGYAHHLNGLPGEMRTVDQIRVDVFIDLLKGDPLPQFKDSSKALVDLRIDMETLMRLNEAPGHIPGHGPVLADIARQVVASQPDAEYRFTVTDPDGREHSGVLGRRATAAMKRTIQSRYPTCTFPGCRMPARNCDLDHRRQYSKGGKTSCRNVAPLCRHHHQCKDRGGWELERLADDNHRWTSPLGHVYLRERSPP